MVNKKMILLGAMSIALSFTCCKDRDAEVFAAIEKDVFFVKAETPSIRTISNEIVLGASVKAMEEATIYSRINGKLVENVLREGDSVAKGQAISYVKKDEVGVVYQPAPIPSTIDGVIGKIYQDPGSDITIQTPIALVVNQKKVRIQMDVPEKYLSNVRLGQKVSFKVEAYPEKVFYASIEKISPVVDKVSKTSLIEAVADNSNAYLKSGMFCEARISVSEAKNVLAVPLSAIVYKDNFAYVYAVNEDGNSVREIKASVGLKDSQYAHIENISSKDKIVTVGLYGIYDGAKISLAQDN